MAFLPTTIFTPLLALLSLYAGQKSYIAITNLQQYEERSEKAAKHLDKAAHDLYKTRVTQASGAAAVCIPLSSSQSLYGSSHSTALLLPSFPLRNKIYHPISMLFYLAAIKTCVHYVMNVDHLHGNLSLVLTLTYTISHRYLSHS